MPLQSSERDFLNAYVYEATNGPPFGGPATRELGRLGIYYADLSWLLTAYQRQLSAEGKPAIGISNPAPPPSPWQNLEEVNQRNQTLKEELEGTNGNRRKSDLTRERLENEATRQVTQ